ncbi:MAG: 2-C-methyl-D-erythritol 4-phosphate cytidylyltransferase [Ruminococcaceae bacterium]|nr:2-C-methyl-D-erythritol 4-phosphate cytidylyltransferase [Oscillospiraceae bacterium]
MVSSHNHGGLTMANKVIASLQKLFGRQTPRKFHSAVILAAGSGVRFGNTEGKHMTIVEGIPVLARSVMAFEACPAVDEIIVVTRKEDLETCRNLLSGITKLTNVVAGGETRQQSAKLGFDAINPASELVSIHDAARCLVTPELITLVAEQASLHGAAAAAEKTIDTVKRADKNGIITETLDREYIWMVKTPQTFLADMYRAASYMAERDGVNATDDCALVERLGFKVKLVECGWENLKITYPEDVYRAKLILDMRREREKEEVAYADRTRI